MKIVIDTNIVFSAILTPFGKIGDFLADRPATLEYIAPAFLLEELQLHSGKILKIAKYNREEYEFVKMFVTKDIEIVNTRDITQENLAKAFDDLADIDIKDIPFLALAYQADAYLGQEIKSL